MLIKSIMALQIRFHPQTRLQVAFGAVLNQSAIVFSMIVCLHIHPRQLHFWLQPVAGTRIGAFTKTEGITRFNGSGDAVRVIFLTRQVLAGDGVIKPVIEQPAINISPGFVRFVSVPGAIHPHTVAVDLPT
ncbi:hypothetical protein C3999_03105 [Escherichia marmotae]|nr:hypothetical protein C4A06_03148 [Escherichia marmotae]RDR84760.1 hypothetical protein C3999_03105 [Escherichia marmotae]RDR91816.1 hypothetical protein C3998_03138 [Escherichia marmotae]